ncbi:MAG: peroxiredoxin [Alphaproteobacteria bacterium]|nr:peroxiredoxin [Alphaproteobacteria bacterium]
MSVQVGDSLPAGTLSEGAPGNKLETQALFGSGKHVVFAVPGAFTPGCSRTHLPGYVEDFDAIKAKGVDSIACVAVNDAFVMSAWGEAHGATGKIRMLADAQGTFTKAMGLDVDAPGLGGLRSKRYAMIVEDGTVTALEVEPDGFGLSCSLSNGILDKL